MLIYTAILVTSGVFVYMRNIDVLDFLYVCSYIKLSITLIKYIPQVNDIYFIDYPFNRILNYYSVNSVFIFIISF